MYQKRFRLPLVLTFILVLIITGSGFRSLPQNGSASFALPDDVRLALSFDLPNYELTYERYQQYFGNAKVFGGQLTLYRDRSGEVAAVIGAHYPGIQASNAVGLSAAQARGLVSRDIGNGGERLVELLINPDGGRYFYRVETRRTDSRWIHWIDAANGGLLQKYDALAHQCENQAAPCGFGVAYDNGDTTDVKNLYGLTTLSGSSYQLLSADGRQETHDTGSTRRPFLGPIATDSDDSWVLAGNTSPAQPALVDAHYYAYVTDQFLRNVHSYDWVAAGIADPQHNISRMVVHAHYSVDYNNAFWNGSYVAIGDGDQVNFRELTPLDVVSHEFTHGVTDFTSNLVYQNESGALNESFSDIVAADTEFWAEANGFEPATSLEPDWFVGEDLDLRSDAVPGFRNMADPEEDGHPDHYSERYTGTDDNGGVHINSAIPNHAYYLLVNGGLNASCAAPATHNSAHCTGSEIPVTAISQADAGKIFFAGFIALTENATFCDARTATVSSATMLSGELSQQVASTKAAWGAVGVTETLCGGGTTNNPPIANFTFTTSELTANFTDASTDSDGSVVSWSWNFGDNSTSTAQNPSHTYGADGTYNVTLTVTDDDGATGSVTQSVSVSSGSTSISLSVTAYKVKGVQYADLAWSGATSTNVDVKRNGAFVATTANDGAYTDGPLGKGGGSATYQVCEAGSTTTCSNNVTVSW